MAVRHGYNGDHNLRDLLGTDIVLMVDEVDSIKGLVCGHDSDGNVAVKLWITSEEYDRRSLMKGELDGIAE